MLKIMICDDDQEIAEKLKAYVVEYCNNNNYEFSVKVFNAGTDLIKEHECCDLILLDVEMEPINGIETAKELRKWDLQSQIVYVTNYDDYKNCAFEVHVFDYITKPLDQNHIYKVLDEIVRYKKEKKCKTNYCFKTDEGIVNLTSEEIIYFEYVIRSVKIVSYKGCFYIHKSLNKIFTEFCDLDYEIPHKSYIVNLEKVKLIRGFDIHMDNGDIVPLAQKRTVKFKTKFNKFLQKTYYDFI